MTDGAPAGGGITYIVSGGGGNGFNAFGTYTQPWTAFRESSYYEYTRITVTPTSLTADAIRSDTDSIFDTTTIEKDAANGPPFVAPPAAPAVTPLIPTTTTVSKTIKRAVKRICKVPKVKGKSLKTARKAVLARGCRVRIRFVVSKKPMNTVLAQSRKAGKKLGFHTVVKLTVAHKKRARAKQS